MKNRARILIIDDEEVVRLSHFRSLVRAGYKADSARNGNEALCLMEQKAFDIVFLDLRMPGMDGIAVLKAIKRQWPDTEVVIITGFPTIATAKEAVRLGAYHYLVKPVGPDDVVRVANKALTHKGWAIRTERPADPVPLGLLGHAGLHDFPVPISRQGGRS
ncbi:MAG TPA: response regulator [Xanthomonadales bacterium]|nr:response regulator [Xanthomonadales bacterium]